MQGATSPGLGLRAPSNQGEKIKSTVTTTGTRLASVSDYKAHHKLCNLIKAVIIKYLFCIMKCW